MDEGIWRPARPAIDPIDWIERIPFTETRQYVVKIMETLQLYRSRLAGPTQALQLVQDLNRGKRIPRDGGGLGRRQRAAGEVGVRLPPRVAAPLRGLPRLELC